MHVLDITIDHTKVAADLSDFPVLIVPTSDPAWDALYAIVTASGGDIRCFKAGGSVELPRDLVSFSIGSKTGEIHVKYSGTLSSTVDTIIELHADGTSADYAVGATFGRNAVWSDYALVHHLLDTTNYTGNASFNLTNVNSVAFNSFQLGNGADFGNPNTTKVLHTGTNEVFNATNIQSNWTVNLWLEPAQVTSTFVAAFYYAAVTGSSKRLWQMQYDPASGRGINFYWVGSTLNHYYTNSFFTASQKYKVTFSLGASGSLKIYVNGSSVLSTTVTNFNARGDSLGSARRVILGGDAPVSTVFAPFSGKMDEHRVRLSQIADDWETTEYENHNNPATFYTVTAAPSSGTEYSLDCEAGTFALSSNPVAFTLHRTFTASGASFALTGDAITLPVGRSLTLDAGAFTLSGASSVLSWATLLSADTGSLVLAGQNALVRPSYTVHGGTLDFTLTASPAVISATLAQALALGHFELTGNNTDFLVASIINPFCPAPRPFSNAPSPFSSSERPFRPFPRKNCE